MKTAVILVNMGGPRDLSEVTAYLEQIFLDPDLIDLPLPRWLRARFARLLARRRSDESRKIYEKLGGHTPLTALTQDQAKALEGRLNEPEPGAFEVFVAMRYWHPFMEDVWQDVLASGAQRVVFLPLYPFYATPTTGSIEKLGERLVRESDFDAKRVFWVRRFGHQPLFQRAMVADIHTAVERFGMGEASALLFSAHSIPQKRIRKGDPYEQEILDCLSQVQPALPKGLSTHLAYQSKVGPIPWLGPATEDVIADLAARGVRRLFLYPFGFVADNSETIYEIGMLYRDLAMGKGVEEVHRIDALNLNPLFIEALAVAVQETLSLQERCEREVL